MLRRFAAPSEAESSNHVKPILPSRRWSTIYELESGNVKR